VGGGDPSYLIPKKRKSSIKLIRWLREASLDGPIELYHQYVECQTKVPGSSLVYIQKKVKT
jgi:hypothetical protein